MCLILFAFAACARVLGVFPSPTPLDLFGIAKNLSNAGEAPREDEDRSSVVGEMDDFPRKSDGRFARDGDAAVARGIFGPDTHGHLDQREREVDQWGRAIVAWYRRSAGLEHGVNGLAQMLNGAMRIGYSGDGPDGEEELESNAIVIMYLLANAARKHLLIAPVVEARTLAASPLAPNGQGKAPPASRRIISASHLARGQRPPPCSPHC